MIDVATSPEAFLISSILRDKDYSTATVNGLTHEMFRAYPDEWEWLTQYVERRKRVPSKQAFVTQFPDFRIKAVNDSAHFADEVRRAYARRQLTGVMSEAAGLIADGLLTDATELIQSKSVQVGATLNGVQDKSLTEDWTHLFDAVKERKDRFDKYGRAGIPTGFETFDERAGGLVPGQLAILGARLSVGKSWTLIRMAMAAMMEGHRVHYASLEMSNAEVGMRLHNFLSSEIGRQVFTTTQLSQGHGFDLQEYKQFCRDMRQHIKGSMTMSDTRGIGISEIAAQIERHNPDVYYLDYLTLARMTGDGDWQSIGAFTKRLKDLAKESNTVIVSAAQLNRQAENVKGMAGNDTIGGSDQIGQDADIVITAKRHSATVLQYKLTKNRAGRDGYSWWANLDPDRGIFQEVSKNDAEDLIDRDKDKADDDA